MTRCEWGALDGHVHLPHPGLAASLRMRLEGANQGDLVVDAQGRFFADRLIPGHYFVLPSARPDGVPGEPLRQVVEILPGATTQLTLDPELRPYGEVEVTLLVNGESPPKGFGVSFESGDQSYYDAVEVDGRRRMKLFVPAGDDYRVVVEPLDGSHMNSYVELRQTVDVKAGSNRFDFEIETCRVTCVIGELHHAALNNTWQFIRFQGPDGAERRGVEAGEHILGKVRPNAERNTIEVTFPYVPVWAKELRFQAEGRSAASKLEVPFRAALKKGASLRVTID